jgi:hypothetical protein
MIGKVEAKSFGIVCIWLIHQEDFMYNEGIPAVSYSSISTFFISLHSPVEDSTSTSSFIPFIKRKEERTATPKVIPSSIAAATAQLSAAE